jgi:hypothetical protein
MHTEEEETIEVEELDSELDDVTVDVVWALLCRLEFSVRSRKNGRGRRKSHAQQRAKSKATKRKERGR